MKTADELKQLLARIGIIADSRACGQFETYLLLLRRFNSRINLTASNNWEGIGPLLQEGAWASRFYPPEAAAHLDIGSGAGFPAVPIQILIPRIQLDLIECRMKRAVFLETVADKLNFTGARVFAIRLKEYLASTDKAWDCISWKGLKLSSSDLSRLREHSHARTQFWMFHGKDLALEEPEAIQRDFRLLRKERFPFRSSWMLSIYIQN